MATPLDLDSLPLLQPEIILPNAVEVFAAIHDNVITNFRLDTSVQIDFPSMWRLAKHVVNERGPLLVYRYKDR